MPIRTVSFGFFFLPGLRGARRSAITSLRCRARRKVDSIAKQVLQATGVLVEAVAVVKNGRIAYVERIRVRQARSVRRGKAGHAICDRLYQQAIHGCCSPAAP